MLLPSELLEELWPPMSHKKATLKQLSVLKDFANQWLQFLLCRCHAEGVFPEGVAIGMPNRSANVSDDE